MYICAETPNLKMQPSNFVLEIARVLQPLKEETDFNDDPINSELGWAYDLLMFNILKIEAFSIMPLKGFRNRIKTCSLPFIDLPSSKIDELSDIVNNFREVPFRYDVAMYSYSLWFHILNFLFSTGNVFIESKLPLNEIESDYPEYRSKWSLRLCRRASIGALLVVELDRDHFLSDYSPHKDEYNIAVFMGASLLKIIGQFRSQGVEFLEKLSVYGIMGAATDFEVVSMYPVFTNPKNLDEFYFVFNSSRKYLRFNIIEKDLLPCKMVICSGTEVEFNNPIENFPGQSANYVPESADDNNPICNKKISEFLFEEGFLNRKALQVLERLAELVYAQVEHIESVAVDQIGPSDPRFKYNSIHIESMTKDRDTQVKRVKLNDHFPSVTIDMINEVISNIGIPTINPEDHLGDNKQKMIPTINWVDLIKPESKYEVLVYETMNGSVHFPRMLSSEFFKDEDGDLMVKMVLEKLSPLSNYISKSIDKEPKFVTGILLDVMGALRNVHGDVTPGNIGFNPNRKLWNLLDFDSSRPIEVASAGGSGKYPYTRGYVSRNFAATGYSKYFPFDDYAGLAFTCKTVMKKMTNLSQEFRVKFDEFINLINNCENSNLKPEQLDFLYLEALKLHLEYSKTPEDPSIKSAWPLLQDMKDKYNLKT